MEKINKLRKFLIDKKIDGYIVGKNDEFFGEYVDDNNDRLNYVSNFSGSFGFALILKSKNYLFVDGRYTLQAINQSSKFFKIITLPCKFQKEIFKKKLLVGFDPRLFTRKTLQFFFKNIFDFKPIDENLIDKSWKRKILNKDSKFYKLPDNIAGKKYDEKIYKIVSFLKTKKADYQFITSSENNAWLLNMRGRDEKYSPIPHCYVLINKNRDIMVFCQLNKISNNFKKKYKKIKFLKLEKAELILRNISKKKFIIDKNTCSFYFENIIKKNNDLLDCQDPIYSFKAIKNKNEIKNLKIAHIYDGVALTKYLIWVKKNFEKKKLTEISASKILLQFRKKNDKFKFLSFPTISGTGPNGAIIHYKATQKTNRILKKGQIYLVDSGGQYEFGTTDVTRTISLSASNKRIKNIFTRVLKGHIAVANFSLTNNTNGSLIDFKARKYLKEIGLDYSHGTGHGVGYFLNVHEGPHSISKNNKVKLKEGMVLSNEPGYYEKSKFGIRIENLIYVKKRKNKKCFENLTMVPIDKSLIDLSLLNKTEKNWINTYHKKVYNSLKRFMNNSEILEFEKACSAL